MRGFQQFRLAVSMHPVAIRFIQQHGMWWAYLLPVVFNVLLFVFGLSASEQLANQVREWIGLNPDSAPRWLIWSVDVGITLGYLLFFGFFSGFVVLILMSPVLAYLSERTADVLEGRTNPQSFVDFLRNIWRAIRLSLTNMAYELFFSVVFLLVGLVPLVGWVVAPVGMFLVSSYFFGFSFIDYMNERARRNVAQSRLWVYRHKYLAIGAGVPFASVVAIPVVGPFLGGFVCVIAAVAGTHSMHRYGQSA